MLAVLSDIHGNLPALEAVIADAVRRGCDGFVNLGDSVSGPLWPQETAALLIARGWPTLAGNQDRAVATLARERMGPSDRFAAMRLDETQLVWLAALPMTLRRDGAILLCHGTPASDTDYLLETVGEDGARPADPVEVRRRLGATDARTILCGHSHLPRVLRLDGRIVANPGSVGLPAYADDAPYHHAMETADSHARYAILGDDGIDLIAVPYDCEHAAAKAEAEGRGDWAIALRTGRAG